MIQNAWSYLSDAQAAQALSDTGQSFAGGTIIDINKAMQPIGTLADEWFGSKRQCLWF